jgi:hypothetical protein
MKNFYTENRQILRASLKIYSSERQDFRELCNPGVTCAIYVSSCHDSNLEVLLQGCEVGWMSVCLNVTKRALAVGAGYH